jgi:hypothetical protein
MFNPFNLLKRREKKMNQIQYWQTGDYLYFKTASIPSKRKKRSSGVIIKSPVTGHAHVVVGGSLLVTEDKRMFIKGPATLKHEEHKDLSLPKGYFEVKQVQEYDHLLEESRAVID